MTPRTPECEVFWPFNSSSKFSGVLEDSKFSLLEVWASPSHLAQSGVATNSVVNFGTKTKRGFKSKTRIKTRTRFLKLLFFWGRNRKCNRG